MSSLLGSNFSTLSVVAPIGPLIEATMNSKQGVKQD